MCRMPPKLRLDTPWPMHKAALRATPAALTFCADVGLYAVLVTRQVTTHAPSLPDMPSRLERSQEVLLLDIPGKIAISKLGSPCKLRWRLLLSVHPMILRYGLQMEYQLWLEETSEGDRDPGASHAYAVAEAAAKAAGSSPTGEVSCCTVVR